MESALESTSEATHMFINLGQTNLQPIERSRNASCFHKTGELIDRNGCIQTRAKRGHLVEAEPALATAPREAQKLVTSTRVRSEM
jgi:hypothetical protein